MKQLAHLACISIFTGCALVSPIDSTDTTTNSTPTPLTVHFTNHATSLFPIVSIEMSDLGKVVSPVYSGIWGANILSGDTLFPGETRTFSLPIPSGNHSTYRLSVIDSLGNIVNIDDQRSYVDTTVLKPIISHWGSDFRTVDVTIGYDIYSNQITINGFTDMATNK